MAWVSINSKRMKLALLLCPVLALFGCVNHFPASGVEDFAVVEPFLTPATPVSRPMAQQEPAVQPKKTLIQLEAEELRIRRDTSLSLPIRLQKLRDIWKQQLGVMGR